MEYMESELSGIFQVKLVTKNIVFGSLGTQHKAALYGVSFWRNKNFLNQTVFSLLNSTLVSFIGK